MEVFTLSRGWKIAVYIALGIFLLVFAILALCCLDRSFRESVTFLLPLSLVAIGFIICGILQVEEKVIVDNYSIRKVSRLINREILLTDIKGYKVVKNSVCIIPQEGKGKKIVVSPNMGDLVSLERKLATRYPDLNIEEARVIYDEAIQQTGGSDADRRLKMAKIEVYTLTGITVALSVLSFLYFGWFQVLSFCCVPLALLMLFRHKGFVQVESAKESQLPSIFFIPLIVLIVQLRQNSFIHILDYSRVWTVVVGVTVALIAMLLFCSRYINKKRKTYILAAVFVSVIFVGNSYGIVLAGNAVLDDSGHEYHETRVIDKSVSRGKNTTYYLTLQPWAHQAESERESVSRQLYNAVDIDDKVGIHYYKGAFNIPWFRIERAE